MGWFHGLRLWAPVVGVAIALIAYVTDVVEIAMNFLSPRNDIEIEEPSAGLVRSPLRVSGTTSLSNLHHYVLVTPSIDGQTYIEGGKVKIASDGHWAKQIRLATGSVGCGDTFMIQILASDVALPVGKLDVQPADAVYSRTVAVTRNCDP